jgi:hypothetical protein
MVLDNPNLAGPSHLDLVYDINYIYYTLDYIYYTVLLKLQPIREFTSRGCKNNCRVKSRAAPYAAMATTWLAKTTRFDLHTYTHPHTEKVKTQRSILISHRV